MHRTQVKSSSPQGSARLSQRNRSWARLLSSPRHAEVLRPASVTPRSIFFTSALLRACGEPC